MSAAEPGPLADEAVRLVEAVRDWVARTFPEPDRTRGHGGLAGSADAATGAEECRYCPLCRAVAVLRGERPEVTERLADAVTAAAGALTAVAEALVRPPATPAAGPAQPGTRVQPIRVDED